MSRRKLLAIILISFFLFIGGNLTTKPKGTIVYSQSDDDNTCAEIVTNALQVVGNSCGEIGRNQLCYGHHEINASLMDEASDPFEEAGNIVANDGWSTVQTEAADLLTGNLGAAVMQLAANTPSDSNGLTVVLLGDTEFSKVDGEDSAGCSVTNPGPDNLNVRGGASTNLGVVGRFEAGSTGTAVGRNEAGDWVLISAGDTQGWVFAANTELSCDIQSLPALELMATTAPVDSLPSYRLTSGESPECSIAPNGMLVHSPDGQSAQIRLNGVELTVNGAGFITDSDDDAMTVRGLGGEIEVSANGQSEVVSADSALNIAFSDGQAETFTTPEPIDGSSDILASPLNATLATLFQNDIGTEQCLGIANGAVEYRTGPDDHFSAAGNLNDGQEILVLRQLFITGENGWWQLSNSGWVPWSALTVTGDCSILPGRQIFDTTIEATPRDGEPICGLLWDADTGDESEPGTIELDATAYLAEGTQIYLEASRDVGEVGLMMDGPNGSVLDEMTEGEGSSIARRFEIEADGEYTLEGYSRGADDSTGLVFAIALCP